MAPGILLQNVSGSQYHESPNVPVNGVLPELHSEGLEQEEVLPIAVVGFSLRFPGDATSPESFWKMLTDKRCAMTEWPKDRINLDAFYHPDSNRIDTIPLRGAHFLEEDLAVFDAPFFSITSAEAVSMDPQQRMLLETAYRALENAGMPIERVSGTKTGVYTGSFADDYKMMMIRDLENLPKYAATGGSMTLLANRLSWFFNLSGPSVNLDTACSSSMIALDIACQGLRNGESNMALVAGSNTIFGLDPFLSLTNMNFLSPDSKCYSFDDRANGYARSEGVGVVVLKLVSEAIRDGDTIRAVIRSTGSSQDGHTPGITQPSRDAQKNLIEETYRKAGLALGSTRFFEAHGTGTAVGDPTEASAIGGVFRKYRSSSDPLYIGAVKSNLGHLEGASGIAGLIKTIMVLEKGVIPPNTNFERLNPKIDANFLNIKFPVSSIPWPSSGLRRASVNSFGFGGANSHVVLDDAYNFLRLRNLTANHCTVHEPPRLQDMAHFSKDKKQIAHEDHAYQASNGVIGVVSRPKLLVWSAADEAGLSRCAEAYRKHFLPPSIDSNQEIDFFEKLAYTLALRRSSLPWKSYALVNSCSQLSNLGSFLSRSVRSTKNLSVGYVFTGQGAQYSGMGQELLVYPVFANTIRRAEAAFHDLGCEWSLIDELLKPDTSSNINDPKYSQPICTALQLALIELLRSFGILPSAVVGHSSGEIAAAYCIGGLSLQSACKVAYHRGRLAGSLSRSAKGSHNRGSMLAVGLSDKEVVPYIEKVSVKPTGSTGLTIACINSPRNITVSGEEAQLAALKEVLDHDHVFSRKLRVDVAYHSPQMDQIAAEYLSAIQDLEVGTPFPGSSSMISSVTCTQIPLAELCESTYWVNNMILPVRFSEALGILASQSAKKMKKKIGGSHRNTVSIQDLLEIGPHSALQGPIKDILATVARGSEVRYGSVLTRHASAVETILHTVGRLHCLGYPVSIAEVNRSKMKQDDECMALACLPEYQFDHSQSYWYETRLSKEYRLRKHPRLDLLGTAVPDWNPLQARWRKFIKVSETPWVGDHKVNGSIVYPAAGMIVMAIEGVRQMFNDRQDLTGYLIKDASFHKTLVIPVTEEGVETQLYIRPTKDASDKSTAWSDFSVCTYEDGQWSENCRGTIQAQFDEVATEVDGGHEKIQKLRSYKQLFEDATIACNRSVDKTRMYEHLQDIGLTFGPAFQPLDQIACNDEGEAIAEVRTFPWVAQDNANHPQPHIIHPTTLDGVAQLFSVALTKGARELISTTIPTRMTNLWISNKGLSQSSATSIQAYTKSAFRGYRGTESSMFALEKDTGDLLISISSLETTSVASHTSVSQRQEEQRKLCYSIDWKPDLDMLSLPQTQTYCELDGFDDEPINFYQDLSLLLFTFISRALVSMAGREAAGMKPYHQKYLKWMALQIEKFEAGNLPSSLSTWANLSRDEQYIELLSSRIESSGRQGKFFVKTGRNLVEILRGDVDPLDLLFREELAEDYYREVFDSVSCCKHLARYLDALAHKNPSMKILEVGSGTGGMTRNVLSPIGVHRYAEYHYTDISSAYFEKARELFHHHSGKMIFKTFDVGSDPQKQDFEPGTYDLVVASSVLHATPDLAVTLQNVRKLLKPGGKLVLFEITKPDLFRAGFVFGLLPGWWLSTEAYREWSPCVSEEKWDEILSENAFSGAELVLRDHQDEMCHEMSIIVSTAVESPPQALYSHQVVLLIDLKSIPQLNVARCVCDLLQANGIPNCKIWSLQESAFAKNVSDIFFIVLSEMNKPLLRELNAQTFSYLQKILASAQGLLWVTCGDAVSQTSPDSAMIAGFFRVLRSENSKISLTTVALEDGEVSPVLHAEKICRTFEAATSDTIEEHEPEYLERNGMMHISRLVEANALNYDIHLKTSSQQSRTQEFGQGPPLSLSIATPGMLDSLHFQEDVVWANPLADHEVEIEVHAVGVNFMDCLTVLGRINKSTLGGECAGIVTRVGQECGLQPGDRVCTGTLGCFKTFTRCDARLVTKIPDDLSFIEAAALPVTYTTSYHALHVFARLQKGESILIHSATGGTGQSAVQIAQHIGAEIYVTVGSEEKKSLIMDLYGIPEDHIFYSRNTTFAQGIMRMTQGRGVDVVLNSLSGDLLVASWECVAPYGRFVEIGKKDIDSHGKLPMFQFAKNIAFGAIDAAAMSVERPALFRESLVAVMALVAEKKLRAAQPIHVYPVSEIEGAFRYMQSGKNTGKTVVTITKQDPVPTVLDTKPSYFFDENATYLIAGGLGGLGRSIARWMVSRGARYLILLSRFGPRNEAAYTLLEELRTRGVQVEVPACDVAVAESLLTALSECAKTMPAIKGCIQGSMVLKDAVFESMTFDNWIASVQPKVQGSWNLHTLLPSGLDFFILLSSVAGIIGSGGQANYAAGNTYMDALAHHRIANGEKAVSLDVGWMKSEGVVAENKYLERGFEAAGFLMPISQRELFALLDHYCDPTLEPLTPASCQKVIGLESPGATRAKGADEPDWMRRPTFSHMHQIGASQATSSANDAEKAVDFSALLGSASSLEEASAVVVDGLTRKLAKALSIPREDIETAKPLHAYGVDSLLAVELRNWFAKEMGANVAIFDIMGAASFEAVGLVVVGKSSFRKEEKRTSS